MHDKYRQSFEEIFKQNERRIHYHMHKLGIHDGQREYYVEGIYAMWIAYKKYDPNKSQLGTYFNYTIRHRLIDMLRKKTKEVHHQRPVRGKVIMSEY
ncbi:sigma factor [Lentibacillus salinarum]|uniref:Sigma factor n=1 Tax=Lentibacillus salinarum TaxID=446820 RepID=A0ABW3ZUK9_9BACI